MGKSKPQHQNACLRVMMSLFNNRNAVYRLNINVSFKFTTQGNVDKDLMHVLHKVVL